MSTKSPSPSLKEVKQELSAKVKREHGRVQADSDSDDSDAAVPHKRQHVASVKVEPGSERAKTPTSPVKQEVHSSPPPMKTEPSPAKETPSPPPTPSIPTVFVYRSCVEGKSWDKFKPSSDPLFPHSLHSSGTRTASSIRTMQDHVLLKWDKIETSPYISLHGNRSWAVFNQLLHEYRCNEMGWKPKYQAACAPWTLYALQVPEADLKDFEGTSSLAHNMVNLAETTFGYLHVRVARHARVVIPSGLRTASNKWFEDRFSMACREADSTGQPLVPHYPYRDWYSYITQLDRGEQWLEDDVTDPVDLWQAGKSNDEVNAAVTAALVRHPIHSQSRRTGYSWGPSWCSSCDDDYGADAYYFYEPEYDYDPECDMDMDEGDYEPEYDPSDYDGSDAGDDSEMEGEEDDESDGSDASGDADGGED